MLAAPYFSSVNVQQKLCSGWLRKDYLVPIWEGRQLRRQLNRSMNDVATASAATWVALGDISSANETIVL